MLSAACAIATTLASEIWPASSTNRTSTVSAMRVVVHSHDVPAARVAIPVDSRSWTTFASFARETRGSATTTSASPRWTAATGMSSVVGCGEDRAEEVGDDLVAGGGDADPFAGREQRQDHPRPGVRLAGTRWAL